ncbi:MAG: cytochrome c biogenesis protein CcsA [Deferrisomatales bacterium]
MSEAVYLGALRLGGALLLLQGIGHGKGLLRARGLAAVPAAVTFALAAWRTAQVGHLPLAGLHETLLTYGLCVAWTALVPAWRHRDRPVFGTCSAAAGVLVFLASAADPRPTPLVPALQTLWFEVHVASSFAAYGAFLVAAAAGAHLLLRGESPARAQTLEWAQRWGFAWFTWGMVSGGIWAYLAWGTYWLWHVKELWSAAIWIFYAGAVHLSYLPRWRGRRQAAGSLIGLGLVLFTYVGVGLLMANTHRM